MSAAVSSCSVPSGRGRRCVVFMYIFCYAFIFNLHLESEYLHINSLTKLFMQQKVQCIHNPKPPIALY